VGGGEALERGESRPKTKVLEGEKKANKDGGMRRRNRGRPWGTAWTPSPTKVGNYVSRKAGARATNLKKKRGKEQGDPGEPRPTRLGGKNVQTRGKIFFWAPISG